MYAKAWKFDTWHYLTPTSIADAEAEATQKASPNKNNTPNVVTRRSTLAPFNHAANMHCLKQARAAICSLEMGHEPPAVVQASTQDKGI